MNVAPTDRTAVSPWFVFALSGVAVFLVSLDATVMVAAYPALVAEYRSVTPIAARPMRAVVAVPAVER